MSFLGSNPKLSISCFVLPPIGVALFYWFRAGDLKSLFPALVYIVTTLVGALAVETGWRGILHDRMRPMIDWKISIFIGCVWSVWKFFTNTHSHDVGEIMLNFFLMTRIGKIRPFSSCLFFGQKAVCEHMRIEVI